MSLKFYAGGEWLSSTHEKEIINPYDQSVSGSVFLAQEEHIELTIKKALSSQKELSILEPYQKADILEFIYTQLKKKHEMFAQTLVKENGKTIQEARGEISRALTVLRIAALEARQVKDEALNLSIGKREHGRYGIVKRFPIGIISGIVPFNFPMNLAMHKIAPAIASGCPIIIKPASTTPLSLLAFAEIIDQSGLPKGGFSVLPCTREVGNQLVTDPRIALLSFTGSPHVGRKMKEQAGKKKVILELGGNAGVIIDKDISDWDWVIGRTVMGSFYQAGQSCVSVQRIYCHKEIYEDFKERFITATKNLLAGDPMDEKTNIGGMINKKNTTRINEWIKEAIDGGATLLTGNASIGNIVRPTLLENVPIDCKLHKEEAFGPVVGLYSFGNIDQAIEEINASDFGLQVGVFSDSLNKIRKVFNGCHVGGVIQNDVPSFRVDSMPYGGIKDSGIGREGIRYAIQDMTEEKILMIKPN